MSEEQQDFKWRVTGSVDVVVNGGVPIKEWVRILPDGTVKIAEDASREDLANAIRLMAGYVKMPGEQEAKALVATPNPTNACAHAFINTATGDCAHCGMRRPIGGWPTAQPATPAPAGGDAERLAMHQSAGLFRKYHITKADGRPIDPDAEYFVLRLDSGGSDQQHVNACRRAVLLYAECIQSHLPRLADDLRARYGTAINSFEQLETKP